MVILPLGSKRPQAGGLGFPGRRGALPATGTARAKRLRPHCPAPGRDRHAAIGLGPGGANGPRAARRAARQDAAGGAAPSPGLGRLQLEWGSLSVPEAGHGESTGGIAAGPGEVSQPAEVPLPRVGRNPRSQRLG
jgi:hypothetical protein